MFDRKAAFWVTTTVLVCLFAIFVLLAVFIAPEIDTAGVDASMVPVLENLGQMVWWMTVGLIMLPIMLLMLALAIYFLFTSKNEVGPNQGAVLGTNFMEIKGAKDAKPSTGSGKVAEAVNPNDALDLRYARGEITRDKYVEMQRDLKKVKL